MPAPAPVPAEPAEPPSAPPLEPPEPPLPPEPLAPLAPAVSPPDPPASPLDVGLFEQAEPSAIAASTTERTPRVAPAPARESSRVAIMVGNFILGR